MGAQKQSRRKNARVWARRARGNASRGGQDIEDSWASFKGSYFGKSIFIVYIWYIDRATNLTNFGLKLIRDDTLIGTL